VFEGVNRSVLDFDSAAEILFFCVLAKVMNADSIICFRPVSGIA
jgi:hypothetical protein